jgi:hypothetical protein
VGFACDFINTLLPLPNPSMWAAHSKHNGEHVKEDTNALRPCTPDERIPWAELIWENYRKFTKKTLILRGRYEKKCYRSKVFASPVIKKYHPKTDHLSGNCVRIPLLK